MVNVLIDDQWAEELEESDIDVENLGVEITREKSAQRVIDKVKSAVNDNSYRVSQRLFYPDYVHPRDYDGQRKKSHKS